MHKPDLKRFLPVVYLKLVVFVCLSCTLFMQNQSQYRHPNDSTFKQNVLKVLKPLAPKLVLLLLTTTLRTHHLVCMQWNFTLIIAL
jgi:hypothetical protein